MKNIIELLLSTPSLLDRQVFIEEIENGYLYRGKYYSDIELLFDDLKQDIRRLFKIKQPPQQ